MLEVRQTVTFATWLAQLRDLTAKQRIVVRIRRLESGNFGDAKMFGSIGELRVDYGPGYRVYFARRGKALVILSCGGDKRTQDRDIARAEEMAREI